MPPRARWASRTWRGCWRGGCRGVASGAGGGRGGGGSEGVAELLVVGEGGAAVETVVVGHEVATAAMAAGGHALARHGEWRFGTLLHLAVPPPDDGDRRCDAEQRRDRDQHDGHALVHEHLSSGRRAASPGRARNSVPPPVEPANHPNGVRVDRHFGWGTMRP